MHWDVNKREWEMTLTLTMVVVVESFFWFRRLFVAVRNPSRAHFFPFPIPFRVRFDERGRLPWMLTLTFDFMAGPPAIYAYLVQRHRRGEARQDAITIDAGAKSRISSQFQAINVTYSDVGGSLVILWVN